jgi:4-hydroxy-2-oxoheptanedioate aldolase
MSIPENTLKTALGCGQVQSGPFLCLGSEAVADIAGRAGFDYVMIDAEHGPFEPRMIMGQLRALQATGTPAAVRVPGHDDWLLKQTLDAGAQTVMVPMVDTPEQATQIAKTCHFPPRGRRGNGAANARASGYGTAIDYTVASNAQVCLIVQIESLEAVENIEAIAAVDGVDGLFTGPADLGGDMGLGDDLGAEALWQTVEDAVRRIAATGKIPGVFAGPERMPAMIAAGALLFGTAGDAGLMTAAMRNLAAVTRVAP